MSKSLVIGTALCFIGVAAHAGGSEYAHDKPAPTPTYTATVSNTAAARASSVAAAAAQSRSNANATGGQSRSNATGGNATGGNATGGNATGGRGGNATGGQSRSNGGTVTVSNSTGSYRSNTPDVIAPSINGGNPCTVGASTGVSLPGFGLMGGGSWEGTDCTRRQAAAMFATMGRSDVAFEILCQNMDVRYAMANAGTPCQADRQRWVAAGWKQQR